MNQSISEPKTKPAANDWDSWGDNSGWGSGGGSGASSQAKKQEEESGWGAEEDSGWGNDDWGSMDTGTLILWCHLQCYLHLLLELLGYVSFVLVFKSRGIHQVLEDSY